MPRGVENMEGCGLDLKRLLGGLCLGETRLEIRKETALGKTP